MYVRRDQEAIKAQEDIRLLAYGVVIVKGLQIAHFAAFNYFPSLAGVISHLLSDLSLVGYPSPQFLHIECTCQYKISFLLPRIRECRLLLPEYERRNIGCFNFSR